MYYKLGFNNMKLNNVINYWWIKNELKLSRYQTQKHKLKNLLKNFDETMTESENLLNNGFYRLFDCGNLTFVKIF
jgi:glycyl-tRNA synthetase alpha subunit